MTQLQFKVSARTARLIGRENIASSKGAIIELVKNGYDADSKISIVYFDNQYSLIQNDITQGFYDLLISKAVPKELLDKVYLKTDDSFTIKPDVSEADKLELRNTLRPLNSLYIIDAGDGMTQNVIRDYWMTIGTDNKETDVFTKSGRIRAGAKGIGRFALDKLGNNCDMFTVFNPEKHDPDTDEESNPSDNKGYLWKVNWEDFEGPTKTIDKVTADLSPLQSSSIKEELKKLIPDFDYKLLTPKVDFKYGTILHITNLREDWEDYFVNEIYSDLEVLVPPKEVSEFKIYLFSTLKSNNEYGEVRGSICDDFDYKMKVIANDDKKIEITIHRNEYDIELIDPNLFKREAFQAYPYTKEDFKHGFWKTERTFSQLIPGFSVIDEKKVLDNIGRFDFTFYFMKRTFSTPDGEKFFYRKFASNLRKDWLKKYGGIKLFRDNFRVRPYGEVNNSSFDWLGLGARKSKNPAAVSKPEGGYVVETDNVAGAINISRIANINFDDKSSREGLQENDEFQIFKQLILGIIKIFEEDRALIAREMLMFYNDKHFEQINRQAAEKLAASIRERREKDKEEGKESKNDDALYILAELNKDKDEQIEKLEDEQKVLRGLASSGIVLASFSHDLSKLNNVLDSRIDKIKELISQKINEKDYANIENRINPFSQLEKMRKQDIKLQNWLNFSLGAARKDKRTRKQLYFETYFRDFKTDWTTTLTNRGIDLDISGISAIDMRVFEIDIDSIFNNLLVNSVDAFNLSKINRNRTIKINVFNTEKEIIAEYYDSGPGLSPDIDKPERIFEPLFTTKRNKHTGEEEGTGLGMWLVKSIITEYDGSVKLLFPENGFGLRMNFPIKYKKIQDV